VVAKQVEDGEENEEAIVEDVVEAMEESVEVGIEDTVLVDIVAIEEEEEKVVEDIEAREVTQVTVVTDRHGMESGKEVYLSLYKLLYFQGYQRRLW